jgi:hypothetical protein
MTRFGRATATDRCRLHCGHALGDVLIVLQLGVGAGLLLSGLRMMAHYYFIHANKDYAARVAARFGSPVDRPMRRFLAWLVLTMVGGLMLATIDITSGLLPSRPQY